MERAFIWPDLKFRLHDIHEVHLWGMNEASLNMDFFFSHRHFPKHL